MLQILSRSYSWKVDIVTVPSAKYFTFKVLTEKRELNICSENVRWWPNRNAMGLQEQTEIIIWYPISLSSIRTVWQTIINIEVNRIVLELWEVKFILENTRLTLSYHGGTNVFQSNSKQFTRLEYALNTKMMFFTTPTHGIVIHWAIKSNIVKS